jgi:hypothetical protein
MSTPISNFREMVRVLIDDNDSDFKLREDAQIDGALRGVLDSGFVPVTAVNGTYYAVDATRLLTSPDLVPATDPQAFVELTYRAAMMFVGGGSLSGGWRTRAFSYVSSTGANAELVMNILQGLYDSRSGNLVAGSDYE